MGDEPSPRSWGQTEPDPVTRLAARAELAERIGESIMRLVLRVVEASEVERGCHGA